MSAAAFALAGATPPAWGERAATHWRELLLEQAHLEKKAAAAAMAFLFRVPTDGAAQRELSCLAREELVHFERTLRLLAQRGVAFGAQAPGPYAERVKAAVARDLPERLVDELLVGALIEARSHERMHLLADALRGTDGELAAFYDDLVQAEARHADIYLDIARTLVPPAVFAARQERLCAHEGAVLRALPWLPRLHGGCDEVAGA